VHHKFDAKIDNTRNMYRGLYICTRRAGDAL